MPVEGTFLAGSGALCAVTTKVASESPIARDFDRANDARHAWDLIDDKLIKWGCDPSQLDEEGTKTPSRETIRLAIQLATALAREGNYAPTRVVPDAHGGIVFEFQGKNIFESVHVEPDGSAYHCRFEDHRLVSRDAWSRTADKE